jgi:hypothetical protein
VFPVSCCGPVRQHPRKYEIYSIPWLVFAVAMAVGTTCKHCNRVFRYGLNPSKIQWNLDLSTPQRSFPVFTMHHLWSRIKFHINNVIYFRIHRSPNCRFSAFIACKSRSRHSISLMAHLRKKLKRAIYVGSVLHTSATCGRLFVCMCVCIQSTHIYMRYILFASHMTFSFKSSILALVFSRDNLCSVV